MKFTALHWQRAHVPEGRGPVQAPAQKASQFTYSQDYGWLNLYNFPFQTEEGSEEKGECQSDTATSQTQEGATTTTAPPTGRVVSVHVPPMEYMLGVADLTGELMRMAIISVSKGDLDQPYKICAFMRIIYEAFVSYGNVSRELPRKLSTLKQSLQKVETACYTLQVRGSEIPKHMLADVIRWIPSWLMGHFKKSFLTMDKIMEKWFKIGCFALSGIKGETSGLL